MYLKLDWQNFRYWKEITVISWIKSESLVHIIFNSYSPKECYSASFITYIKCREHRTLLVQCLEYVLVIHFFLPDGTW
jgi:hypothetical protein